MTGERIYLYDTTLRDGAQTQGVDFNPADKAAIARELDRLRSASNDPGLTATLGSGAKVACLVGKTWDFHVETALAVSLEENLAMIVDSVALAAQRLDEVIFDAEHFFDGYKANPGFALDCLAAARASGARWIVLCDTNGGSLPDEVERIVGDVAKTIPGAQLGIHCHNDTENAVANSLAAVRAGARHVQGTLNGLGERCGNANLVALLPTLLLKEPYVSEFETHVTLE